MNDELRAAVERLFATCLDVTLAGKCNAHIHYAPHCGSVQVYVYPVGTPYTKFDGREPLTDQTIYIHHPTLTAGDAVAQINALIGQLNVYLQEDAA